ncbi:hypothetical protein RB623_08240 [Mesorhizobium sp. LHD-90]|uniref:hypothetical protein n=1 Tax=Mesorhizobium sp. LHD-90 TaxID=3071414 RepID=UPI0027DF4A8B|nr:hypothetical protein [Mesorhizobium sp. LHD-90]MDQ6434034.1 hypothetical protein [Mesorhizobium sp. LHD-90]
MSLLFDAFPKESSHAGLAEDRLRPRPAGMFRLAMAICLITAVVGALEFGAQQTGDEAARLAAYDARQQGDVR